MTNKTTTSPIEEVISLATASRLIGRSKQTVLNLVNAGFVERHGKGEYTALAVTRGYVAFLLDEQRRASKTAAASSLAEARAREIELRIAREDHTIILLDEAQGALDSVTGRYVAGLASLPARIARNDMQLRGVIEIETDKLRVEIAQEMREQAAALAATGKAK